MAKRHPSVVLVGRPNVGKSTLFNRITGMRRAIVTPIPGTTRDVIAQEAEWLNVPFEMVDTGGMFGASEDPLHELVLQRGHRAIEAADLLVFVVDGRDGVLPGDNEIGREVHASGKPAILAINKTDDKRARNGAMDFYQLGFDPIVEVSAEHGEGIGDLLDAIVARLRPAGQSAPVVEDANRDGEADGDDDDSPADRHARDQGEVAVSIVGRPNAGKSSLVNRLLREERMIVSEMPGTTRDAVDTMMTWHRRNYRIVDTAGIRKAGRVQRGGAVETLSVMLAQRSIEAADIVVLMVDATEGVTDQDAAIAGAADKAGRGVIVVANKWDLMKDRGPDFVKGFDEEVRRRLKFLDYAPILHISALTGERASKLLETIDKVTAARRMRVKTPELNNVVAEISLAHPPASPGKQHVRILYAAQTGVAPPTFVFFTNVATQFHFSYERFLVNQLREKFGFEGTPIRFHVRTRRRVGKASTSSVPSRASKAGEGSKGAESPQRRVLRGTSTVPRKKSKTPRKKTPRNTTARNRNR